MVATMHSLERAKDRIGMNQKTAEHFMRNALERGKDKTMYTSERRRWLTAKEDACGCKALVYNDMCLIVTPDNVVVTMYKVPDWFRNAVRYKGKDRVRNQAKFERYNRRLAEAV